MQQARITFSNDEKLIVSEGDLFVPVNPTNTKDGISSSQGNIIELFSHTHVGLIPSLTELTFKSEYFHNVDDQDTVYKTSAIVKIENI